MARKHHRCAVLPVIKEYGAAVISLTLDENGIPNDPEICQSIARIILERAAKFGIPTKDVVIDPLALYYLDYPRQIYCWFVIIMGTGVKNIILHISRVKTQCANG